VEKGSNYFELGLKMQELSGRKRLSELVSPEILSWAVINAKLLGKHLFPNKKRSISMCFV